MKVKHKKSTSVRKEKSNNMSKWLKEEMLERKKRNKMIPSSPLEKSADCACVCVCGVFMAAAEIFPVFMLCYYFSWPALKLSTKTMKTRSRKIKLVLRGCCSFCLLLGLLGSASVEGSPSVTTSPQQEMKHFLVCLQRC